MIFNRRRVMVARVPGGKRLRSIKRLQWAQIVGLLTVIGLMVPIISWAYGGFDRYITNQTTLAAHTKQLTHLSQKIETERLAREKAELESTALQNKMDGKLDVLIQIAKSRR